MGDWQVGSWIMSMGAAGEGRGGSGRPSSSPQVEVREAGAEERRLQEDADRHRNWKRWGTYLSERQLGTVREDYSAHGDCWNDFPHDHARSRAYRWGEDGLLGLSDREGRLCFALALWNGRDPILKERLFGLAGPEGNHGEDVKEARSRMPRSPRCSPLWTREGSNPAPSSSTITRTLSSRSCASTSIPLAWAWRTTLVIAS